VNVKLFLIRLFNTQPSVFTIHTRLFFCQAVLSMHCVIANITRIGLQSVTRDIGGRHVFWRLDGRKSIL